MRNLLPGKTSAWMAGLLLLPSCSGRADPETALAQTRPTDSHEVEGAQAALSPSERASAAAEAAERGSVVLELGEDAIRDLRLTTRKVERRPAGDTLIAAGSLEIDPDRLVVVSTPVGARVRSVARKVGESVAAGEELVVLESLEIGRARAALAAASARVEIARSRAKLALEQRDALRELAADHMATVRDVQAAEADHAARSADLSEAELTVRDAERALTLLPADASGTDASFPLRAPAAGVVVFRDGAPGEAVEAGHLFFRIADLTELQAVVHPFERDGVRVDSAATVRLRAPAHPEMSFAASYLLAGPEIDRESRTLPLRLMVPNPDGLLLPGMSVTAEIRLAAAPGTEILAVPIAAVQRIEREWCVFLPLGGGRFERRVIARGRDLGGEVEVLSGLEPDTEFVVEGAFVLRSESVRGADSGEEDAH